MRNPHYFLGVELIPTSKWSVYVPSLISLLTTAKHQLHDASVSTNSATYRQIIGALQHLNPNLPDFSVNINKLSQFMRKPITIHLQHLKRLFLS